MRNLVRNGEIAYRSVGATKTMRTRQVISVAGAMLLLAWSAAAQEQTIKIWPGVAPGSENWSQPETVMKGADTDRVANVVTPNPHRLPPGKEQGHRHRRRHRPWRRVLLSGDRQRGASRGELASGERDRVFCPEVPSSPDDAGGHRGLPGAPWRGRGRAGEHRASTSIGGRGGAPATAAPPAGAAGAAGRSMDEIGQFGIADGVQALKTAAAACWRIWPDASPYRNRRLLRRSDGCLGRPPPG